MIKFIVNEHSGNGKGKKAMKKISNYCSANNIAYSVSITKAQGHATALTKELTSNLDENITLVAVGGDGTFSEVLNGIANFEKAALGFIPTGRGNDYARAANLKLKPLNALKDILNGTIVTSDYFMVGNKRCLNVAGSGLDVAVLERVGTKRGKLSYLKSLIYCLRRLKPYSFEIEVNGEIIQEKCVMIGVCNGVAIGGGIKLSPLSKLNDGKLNLMIMLPPKNLLSALLKFKKGKHMNEYYTTHIVCDSVRITCPDVVYPIQIDGEIYKNTMLDCSIVAGGLRTFKVI